MFGSSYLTFRAGRAGGVKLFALLIVCGTALAGAAWLWMRAGEEAVTYQTTTVTRGDLTQAVTATGTLNPLVNVQVGSQISGIIQKLYADFNTEVKAGQVVAQIDPATFKAAVTQAEGDLANAKAGLELAEINANRAKELRARDAAPQSTVDTAIATLHQAEATVKVKEGALARARTDLDRCTITSPIDGIVISRNVDVGQTVAASLQAPVIFTIANDLTKMEIHADVAEADIGNIAVGQDVEFTVDAFPTRTFRGKVIQIRNAPTTVQNVVSYDTVIEVNNAELVLKPGMTANVSIIIAQREGVLKLGNAALRFRMPEAAATASPTPAGGGGGGGLRAGGGRRAPRGQQRAERTVYVLRGDAASEPQPVQIKTGITDGIFTEVTDGLKEGDRVVIASIGGPGAGRAAAANPFGGGMRRF